MYITKERYLEGIKNYCKKDKHKFRTNKFGVTWCTRCGLLSTSDAKELSKDDSIIR